jgi:hypothetical protein
MADTHLSRDVFTPTRPARLTFVEREQINQKLVAAISTPGKQVVVYGHSGSGKTTLLVNKLHQLYESHLTTRCIEDLSFAQVVLDAFDQLGSHYQAESSEKNNVKKRSSLQAEYAGLKAAISAESSRESQLTTKRILPPQLTPQTLARFMGKAKLAWVLEDFHKLPTVEKKKLAQVMKVFMDMADEFPELKIIAIGAVDTARQVVECDPEMRNRVAEIHVPLMSAEEVKKIVETGQSLLNISIPFDLTVAIAKYANGLASVCHHLCLNICNSANIIETVPSKTAINESHLKSAVQQYLDEASDTLKGAFDRAFKRQRERKYDNCRYIIEALADCSQEGATPAEILTKIRSHTPVYPQGNLTTYLNELQRPDRGSLIRYDHNSGKYSFADPVFRAFALAKADPQKAVQKNSFAIDLTSLLGKFIAQDNSFSNHQVFRYTTVLPTIKHHDVKKSD